MEYNIGVNCHLLYPLDGDFPGTFFQAMRFAKKSTSIHTGKLTVFLESESVDDLESLMGFDVLESKAYVSKEEPAVVPYPFGLVLQADVKQFNGRRSYGRLEPTGAFAEFENTSKTDLATLMTDWYACAQKPTTSSDQLRRRPHYNEAILNKGAHIVAGYQDRRLQSSPILEQHFEKFSAHIQKLGLPLMDVNICHL